MPKSTWQAKPPEPESTMFGNGADPLPADPAEEDIVDADENIQAGAKTPVAVQRHSFQPPPRSPKQSPPRSPKQSVADAPAPEEAASKVEFDDMPPLVYDRPDDDDDLPPLIYETTAESVAVGAGSGQQHVAQAEEARGREGDGLQIARLSFSASVVSGAGAAMHRISRVALDDEKVWADAATWQSKPALSDETVTAYLARYGMHAEDMHDWRWTPRVSRVELAIDIQGHNERAGHTWYQLVCKLSGSRADASAATWPAPRRLCQLRTSLHDPVARKLAGRYNWLWDEKHFAMRGGVPGTTARLKLWFSALTSHFNDGTLTPYLVALTLLFLQAPAYDKRGEELPPPDLPEAAHWPPSPPSDELFPDDGTNGEELFDHDFGLDQLFTGLSGGRAVRS